MNHSYKELRTLYYNFLDVCIFTSCTLTISTELTSNKYYRKSPHATSTLNIHPLVLLLFLMVDKSETSMKNEPLNVSPCSYLVSQSIGKIKINHNLLHNQMNQGCEPYTLTQKFIMALPHSTKQQLYGTQ